MAKTDDGHYELVLGNRQLVSGFFVLIILFAIFLTLGYVLGRNSVVVSEGPETVSRTTAEDREPRSPVPAAIANQGKPSASEPVTQVRPAEPEDAAIRSQPAATSTALPSPSTAVTKPAQEPKAQTETPKPTAAAPSAAQQILNSRVRVITPRKGDTFVQVAAIGRAEAELMAEQLQQRGYRTFITEVPGKDLFRVLLGPFETPAKVAETRAKLAQEGIESIVQRY